MNLKKQLKNRIEDLEYYQNSAGGRLNGVSVKVTNIKIRKRLNTVYADITVIEDEDGHRERFNNCEYDLEILEKGKN